MIHHNPSYSAELGIDPVFSLEQSSYTPRYSAPQEPTISFVSRGFVPHIGYRYQKEDGGFFAKIHFCLLMNNALIYQTSTYSNQPNQTIVYWGGVGVGYTFKRSPKI